MPRVLSQDLRERVVAAVDGGMSCRAAAARFGQRGERGPLASVGRSERTPAAKPQGGDRRAARIDAHASFILGAIEAKDDITLVELQALLAERGTPVRIGTPWRFFDRHRITRKKDGICHRAGPPGCLEAAGARLLLLLPPAFAGAGSTAPTSTRSNRPSPSSRRTCAKPPSEPSTASETPSAASSTSTRHRNAPTTSQMPATMQTDRKPL